MSLAPWPAKFISKKLSPVPKSYNEAQLWAVLKPGNDHRPSHASWEVAVEARVLGVCHLQYSESSVGPWMWQTLSFSVTTSWLKPQSVELWTSVNFAYGMTSQRPRGIRERLYFASTLSSQFVSNRDGCQVIRNGVEMAVMIRTAVLQSLPPKSWCKMRFS